MIDAKEYNLKYICKTSKEIFSARTVGNTHIAVLENGKEKMYTIWEARLKFNASKSNRKAGNKPRHAHPIARAVRKKNISSRAFNEWLNESNDKICSNY